MTKNQGRLAVTALLVIVWLIQGYVSDQKEAAMSRAVDCAVDLNRQWAGLGGYSSTQAEADEIARKQTACYTNEGLDSPDWSVRVLTD